MSSIELSEAFAGLADRARLAVRTGDPGAGTILMQAHTQATESAWSHFLARVGIDDVDARRRISRSAAPAPRLDLAA